MTDDEMMGFISLVPVDRSVRSWALCRYFTEVVGTKNSRLQRHVVFKLCHRPRSTDLVWIAAFNQCTAQLPSTFGPAILPSLLDLLHLLTPLQAPTS